MKKSVFTATLSLACLFSGIANADALPSRAEFARKYREDVLKTCKTPSDEHACFIDALEKLHANRRHEIAQMTPDGKRQFFECALDKGQERVASYYMQVKDKSDAEIDALYDKIFTLTSFAPGC